MSVPRRFRLIPPARLTSVLVTLILAFIAGSALALTDWDGGGLDNLLKTGKNWVGDKPPAKDGTERIRFAGSVRPVRTSASTGCSV